MSLGAVLLLIAPLTSYLPMAAVLLVVAAGLVGFILSLVLYLNRTSHPSFITLVLERLDPERCRVCRVRIFDECARMPGAAQPLTTSTGQGA